VCYNHLFICKLICHFSPNYLVPKQLKKLWFFILFYFSFLVPLSKHFLFFFIFLRNV
jgi:hypothetical protein